MGLFDKFKDFNEKRKVSKIQKATKHIKNAKAIKEDRWAALEYLGSLDSAEEGVPGLLERFEYSLEHGILDTREKELAMKGIVKFGEGAVSFCQERLKSTTKIAWPIKVLKEVSSDQVVVECLESALNFDDVSFDQMAVDKNYDILCYLADYKIPGSSSNSGRRVWEPRNTG